MRKYITMIVIAAVLAVVTPIAVTAQTRSYNDNYRESRSSRSTNYNQDAYYDEGYYEADTTVAKKPNIYQRHRKAMNIAIATGAGAILGALFGGKKGALIGAGAGVVTGAIITKKQKPKNYYRY